MINHQRPYGPLELLGNVYSEVSKNSIREFSVRLALIHIPEPWAISSTIAWKTSVRTSRRTLAQPRHTSDTYMHYRSVIADHRFCLWPVARGKLTTGALDPHIYVQGSPGDTITKQETLLQKLTLSVMMPHKIPT